ncbi:flavin reductase family protein [Streptacidiphilus neutrinimicus]|uniref:flavin reductase family protein n=1 Tax=Streptacidiphilus neutrinimicus TaxID=105420 RepID=UPI000AE57A66|nr:flavin reductase family protein [Streptacidiphilus neutrinimicus]
MGHEGMAVAAVRYLRAAGAPLSVAPVVAEAVAKPELQADADARALRDTLGHFATGVTVITAAAEDGQPVGFACQSFASLSLDPPLICFNVARTSSSWPRIARTGAFCVNVLAEDQGGLCRSFAVSASTGADKFAGVAWEAAPATGSPRLEGALAWVDCTIHAVHTGGDHLIVLGRVRELAAPRGGEAGPLVFYRSGFRQLREPRG